MNITNITNWYMKNQFKLLICSVVVVISCYTFNLCFLLPIPIGNLNIKTEVKHDDRI